MIDLASPFLKALLKHSKNPVIIFKVKPVLVVVEHNDAYQALIARVGGKLKFYDINIVPNLLSAAEKVLLIKTVQKVSELKAKSTFVIHPIYSNSPNVKWELEFSPVLQNDRPVEYIICSLREIPLEEMTLSIFYLNFQKVKHVLEDFLSRPLWACVY